MATKPRPAPVSDWTVHGLLAKLPGFRRVDYGGERYAFRLAGDAAGRTVYVCLFGEDPSAIHFDLEGGAARPAWSGHGPEHGRVWSAGDLALVLRWWLGARG